MKEIPYIENQPDEEQINKQLEQLEQPEMLELYNNVQKALSAVPAHFSSPIHIEGIDATDLYTLNTLLSSAIEVQTTRALNDMRTLWDPEGKWTMWKFQRFPASFPDTRLVNPEGEVALGVELKGWFLLTKESEPTCRFSVTREACASWDLLAVFPWSLDNVLSGTPILHTPFVNQARYIADMRTYYWQHRKGTSDKNIECPDNVHPYMEPHAKILDTARGDNANGNFGRIARIKPLTNEWVQDTLDTYLAGIEARYWILFLKIFSEGSDSKKVADKVNKIADSARKERHA